MESAEPFPQGAVKAPELAELLAHARLFVSVYLHTDPDVAKAAQRSELRWKSVRSDLEAKGAPGPAIERIEVEVADAHTRGRMLGAVVDADARAHIEHGDPFGPHDFGRAHSVPYVVPMIRWRQASPPVVVVLIDRVGADVFAITRDRQESREIQGTDTPIHKVHAGGWSMRRYQERAENTWGRNAENVANTVRAMAERVGARRIAVAGDVRAVSLLRDAVPVALQPLLLEIPGDRPRDLRGDPISDKAERVVADIVQHESAVILDRLRQELGEGDLGVQGTAGVVAALAQGRVETLILEDDVEDDSTLWVGHKPSEIAMSAGELRSLGVTEPLEARRPDAIVRAALATDAGVRVVDTGSNLQDDVGALLRWRNGDDRRL